MTFACWFNTDVIGANQVIQSIGVNGGTERLVLLLSSTGGIVAQSFAAGVAVTAAHLTVCSSGTWYHACAVFSSTTSRSIYLNGTGKVTDTTASNPSGFDRTNIGIRWSTTRGLFFDGLLFAPSIWNVALTDAEVVSLAAGFSPKQVRPASLVRCAPLYVNSTNRLVLTGTQTDNAITYSDNNPRIIGMI